MIGVTTSVVQDTRIRRKDGTYAIKLRLTYNRQQKYYPLGKHLTIEDWIKTQSERPRGIYKDDKLFFNEIEQKANEVIRFLSPFSFAAFEKKFNQKTYDRKNVFELLDACIDSFETEGRINTADNFKYTKKSFEKFIGTCNRKHLYLDDVTVEWLTQYEKWMINNGGSPTTTGIYLRNLRTILNIAIEEGNFNKENYPFGKRKYRIPSGRNIKKALVKSDIKRIIEYVPVTKAEEKARDLWLFSYLCNGINVTDIAELQYKDIHEKSIIFIRSKTKRSEKENLR